MARINRVISAATVRVLCIYIYVIYACAYIYIYIYIFFICMHRYICYEHNNSSSWALVCTPNGVHASHSQPQIPNPQLTAAALGGPGYLLSTQLVVIKATLRKGLISGSRVQLRSPLGHQANAETTPKIADHSPYMALYPLKPPLKEP